MKSVRKETEQKVIDSFWGEESSPIKEKTTVFKDEGGQKVYNLLKVKPKTAGTESFLCRISMENWIRINYLKMHLCNKTGIRFSTRHIIDHIIEHHFLENQIDVKELLKD